MFLTVFVILLVMWLLGFFAFHVAGGLIHLLLILGVISLVMLRSARRGRLIQVLAGAPDRKGAGTEEAARRRRRSTR